jgi:tetratricopeptide (TPR) repeat protein
MIDVIKYLIPKLESDLTLGRIYDVMGGLYWLVGKPRKAIDHYKKSGDIADKYMRSENDNEQFLSKRLKRLYYFNTGLAYISLFELQKSMFFFEEALGCHKPEMSYKNGFNKNDIEVARVDTLVYVAFLDSCLSKKEKALNLADQLSEEIEILNKKTYFDSWARGYHPLFLGMTYKNLGDINKSFKMYDYVIQYAEESHFKQVKAKALTGLGELYRIQKKYDIALVHHFDSIEILDLDKIGAKCDLAEAYFQLALTYQAKGDQPNSQTYFDKALELWGPEKIDAPKQIERVKKAMQTTFA